MEYLDKKVMELLIKAQMCSDSGKHIYRSFGHNKWKNRADKWEYAHKPTLVFAAFDRISQLHGKSGFAYYIGTDNYGNTVVYFNFKYDHKRYQISFHMPEGIPKRYLAKNKSHYTRWDGYIGGSVEAVDLLSQLV